MTWIGRTRHKGLGFEVRVSQLGSRVGWVQYSGEWRHWRAFCDSSRCGKVGDGRTRVDAADRVVEHWAIEHR